MTADPRDPATWPSDPPAAEGAYFICGVGDIDEELRTVGIGFISHNLGAGFKASLVFGNRRWVVFHSNKERMPSWLRWYPVPITTATVLAEGQAP